MPSVERKSSVLVRTGDVKKSQTLALLAPCWGPSLDTQQDIAAVKMFGRYVSHLRPEGVKASSPVQFRGSGLAIRNPGHQDRKSSRDGGLRPGQPQSCMSLLT